MKRIAVIGAGPAGMMAAGTAANEGAKVTLFEKNQRPGRKLIITGKGRCNITNNCDREKLLANIVHNPKFLYSAFAAFSPNDTMEFFESRSVPLKTERGGRVFPVSDKAMDINDAMVGFVKKSGARIEQANITEIEVEDGCVRAVKSNKGRFECDCCVIATGGASYPGTGSDGSGYKLAQSLGHTLVPISPSLVPMVCDGGECARMQGLSLKNISITVKNSAGKTVYTDFGELLFTHFGLSGPVILSASSHIDKKKDMPCTVSIDLKPALSEEQLDARILREFSENMNKDFENFLRKLLPKSMIDVVVARSGIMPYVKVNSITRAQRESLVKLLKSFDLKLVDFRPINEAIVTAGGISVKEINPKTMESKLVKGLYFAGEVIDVDAHTGGYNLQIALSTGVCAGKAAAQDQ
ncbi:MAG: NAD(P)/FAD-dependent oxidoreductase [Ruminococcaceae bacterium]|nr:NAD(P)/FAD-dependent oxidoreductase [Oscillospiraceae bacterium]